MQKKMIVGDERFDVLRNSSGYYIDKTELIYGLVEQAGNTVTLFTRPRRFGKTLTMTMMESFFDIRRSDGPALFEGLQIMSHTDFCKKWMNQYPVIFLSLKDAEGLSFDAALSKLRVIIADLTKKHDYLADCSEVNPFDKELFLRLQQGSVTPEELQSALKLLMRMMAAVHGKPAILLIDEYDVPLAKASERGYYTQMLDLIRGIMSVSLKTNEYLRFAVITGCLRIAKESIFTGVNNFSTYSVLDDRYADFFGFTPAEVDQLLAEFKLEQKADTIRQWYDGYRFGNADIYCPWDVVSYVSDLLYNENTNPKNYWKNTSGNGVIKSFFERTEFEVSDKFETLLNGGFIRENVEADLTYDRLYDSESSLWSVLLMTGYLTTVPGSESGVSMKLQIPNREIASIFQDTVVDHFVQSVDQSRLNALMNVLWSGDADAASKIMSDLLWETISYMDYHEDYYHAFLAGLFVGRGYEVSSNKERGLGRPDIVLRDKRNRRAIVLEAKKADGADQMKAACQEGLAQIVEKQYAKQLSGYETVQCYAVAFYQKTALVKQL